MPRHANITKRINLNTAYIMGGTFQGKGITEKQVFFAILSKFYIFYDVVRL